jgi:hypothetical protein
MMDFLFTELVNTAMDERSREAEATRVAADVGRANPKPRLRPRVALALGGLAARIHPEAARHAVGLRAPPRNGPSRSHGWLCLCEE